MRSRQFSSSRWLVIFDPGEDLIAGMHRFLDEHGITGGWLQAIGGLERATIAWWGWDEKKYEEVACDEQVEVLSLTGNISSNPDRRVHAHVVLGKRGGATIGGHLLRATVRPTVEMLVTVSDQAIDREMDPLSKLQMIRIP